MRTPRANQKGFTLIEVVIALGVLAFGILTMFSMQAFGIRGNAVANKITREVSWSATGFEKLLNEDFQEVYDGKALPDLAKEVDTNLYNVTWTVTPDKPIIGMMTVKVNITSKNDNKVVEMEYTKTNEDKL